jgi:hypothetical protein
MTATGGQTELIRNRTWLRRGFAISQARTTPERRTRRRIAANSKSLITPRALAGRWPAARISARLRGSRNSRLLPATGVWREVISTEMAFK